MKGVSLARCPCRCFTGNSKKIAKRQCKRTAFINRCEVRSCPIQRSYNTFRGLTCCEKQVVSSLPSVSPAPSASALSQQLCPCYCHNRRWKAKKQCSHRPRCIVVRCYGFIKRERTEADRNVGGLSGALSAAIWTISGSATEGSSMS